jgi:hypothetical protein
VATKARKGKAVRRRSTRRKKRIRVIEDVHSVKASLQVPGLSKAGSSLKLLIYAHQEQIGEIQLGRGSLFWRGANRKTRKQISWTRFAEMMDQLAYEGMRLHEA